MRKPSRILFFLSLNLLIGWQLSIWNCCKPFFSLLYKCHLLCFWRRILLCSIFIHASFLSKPTSLFSLLTQCLYFTLGRGRGLEEERLSCLSSSKGATSKERWRSDCFQASWCAEVFSVCSYTNLVFHSSTMREIVHLQAGQCGNQIGAKVSLTSLQKLVVFRIREFGFCMGYGVFVTLLVCGPGGRVENVSMPARFYEHDRSVLIWKRHVFVQTREM